MLSLFLVINYNALYNFVELHVDNAAQANKLQPAEEVPEELPQEPPMEALQTIEEKQETKTEIISANESQVINIDIDRILILLKTIALHFA